MTILSDATASQVIHRTTGQVLSEHTIDPDHSYEQSLELITLVEFTEFEPLTYSMPLTSRPGPRLGAKWAGRPLAYGHRAGGVS